MSNFDLNKNAYQHCIAPEISLTELLHISFPAKSHKVSLLILLNNTGVSFKLRSVLLLSSTIIKCF